MTEALICMHESGDAATAAHRERFAAPICDLYVGTRHHVEVHLHNGTRPAKQPRPKSLRLDEPVGGRRIGLSIAPTLASGHLRPWRHWVHHPPCTTAIAKSSPWFRFRALLPARLQELP